MSFIDTFLKYHNAGIGWKCPVCNGMNCAIMEVCTIKCKDEKGQLIIRPFDIVHVVTVTYFDGVEERWKSLT